MINVKRIYEKPSKDDGFRVLVDRLWPRGLKKDAAKLDLWLKEVAPSNELRTWYGHEPDKWNEFKRRYFEELDARRDDLKPIRDKSKKGTVTLLYSSKEDRFNNAVALQEYLKKRTKARTR
ncbi:MAG: DUF488 domain-containing protein [Candidatus Abyssubacteria bacterium]